MKDARKTILEIAPYAKEWVVAGLVDAMPAVIERAKLKTPLRLAHFLAQLAHESAGFKTTEEYASGAAYEGRRDLGNTQPGDGRRFKGRGLIQVTGRHNYRRMSRALGQDFEANPELLRRFPAAAITGAIFWDDHRLNDYADADNILTVTRRINGGTNGLDDRRLYLARAKKVLGLRK
jgi:putative chitinase